MIAKTQKRSPVNSSENNLVHSRNLLLALSRASQSVQKARTAEEIYQAVGKQIKSLGYDVFILTLRDEDQYLDLSYSTFSKSMIKAGEKLTGLSIQGFGFPILPGSTYERIIKNEKGELVHLTSDLIADAIPKELHTLAERLARLLKIEQSVIAPMCADGKTLGTLAFASSLINEEDIPAVESFAAQVAISLENARLAQQVENELKERMQAEEALRASEAKIHALLDAIPDMMFMLNREGIFLDYHASQEQMLFAPPESFLGNNIQDVMPPQMVEAYTSKLDQAIQTGKGQLFEYSLDLMDGLHHYEAHVVAYQNKNVLCMIRDITRRKHTEDALRLSEALLNTSQQLSKIGGWDLDVKNQSVFWTDETYRIHGFAANEIKSGSMEEYKEKSLACYELEDRPIIIAAFQRCVEQGEPYDLEFPFTNFMGRKMWIRTTARAVWEEARIVKVIGNVMDVTAQKQVEEDLRASESKFHSVVTESADGIMLSDETGRIIEFNNASEQIAGLKREAVMGQFMWDVQSQLLPDPLHNSELQEQMKFSIQKALESGQSPFLNQMIEVPFKYLDNSLRFIQQRVFSMQTEKGWRLGAIFRDITERKQAEEALRASEERSRSLYQMINLMANNLPDLVWAKDMDGRFIFANKAITEKLLIAQDTEEPIGKTDLYFAERQRAAHPENSEWHTFGELCVNSDEIIHASQSPQRFEEFGNVKGEFLFLDVYKAPFLDEQGNMIGTVGIGRDVTYEKKLEKESKQAQEALAASEAELRVLFTSMQDAVLVIDQNGVYRKIAPTKSGRFYISPEMVIGKNLTDFFPAEQAETLLKAVRRVLETRQTVQVEYELILNGQSPWFESSISPMDADHTLWVARDITERKKVDEKLHLQSAALEAAANTIVITDHDGLIQWANSSFTDLTGFDSAEAIGKNPRELIKSGMQDQQFYKNLWNTILSGKIWHNELINRRKDGDLYFEEMTITPLRNMEGEISHFIAVKQDITERKHVEAALIRSEQAHRTLFENMPIGLYRISLDGQILDANTAFANMFGYPDRSSLLAVRAKDLYANPASDDMFKNEISKKGILSAFEAEFRRYDGNIFWAEDYVHIIRDKEEVPLHYEGSLIDITERKLAQDELRNANKSLETAHRELQHALAHEQVLARTDSLTGLYNRRYFHKLAEREFSTAVRYQRPLSILLFDIDGFKHFNDTFGHALGDSVLIETTQAAVSQVREVDVLARYGGDEFIILFPQTNAQDAFQIAERIRRSIETTRVVSDGGPLSATISIGIAELDHASQNKSVEDIIRDADKALYSVKQNGSNYTVIFTPDLMDNS